VIGQTKRRKSERGAALIMVLLIAAMVLAVSGAMIMSTASSLTSTLDATTETRAYYASEAGLQAALNVLRGNVAPSPLPVAIPVGSPVPPEDQISLRGAVTRSISNASSDPSTQADGSPFPMRLSHWLQYDATYTDRVPLTAAYNPMNGDAYSLDITEPDNSQTVTYTTAATFTGGNSSYTFGGSTIRFTSASNTVSAVTPAAVNLGSFTITSTGSSTDTVPPNIQVNLRITQSAPWSGTVVIGGTLTGRADKTGPNLKLTLNSDSARVSGTLFSISSNPFIMNSSTGTTSSGTTTYNFGATLTAPDARRLKIRSTGYGPRGARKILEMYVSRNKYYIDPPAPIVIRGADDTAATMTFDLGSSNAKRYSGKDFSSVQAKLPTVAIRLQDWTKGFAGITKGSTVDNPKFAILDLDSTPSPWTTTLTPVPSLSPPPAGIPPPYPMQALTPDFLVTASAARTFLNDMEATAHVKNRYFSSFSGMAGSVSSPKFTFVDGDCTLDGGAGLLVVTGNLYFDGNDDFKGIILALGNGHVERNGSGNGRVLGSWMVASFSRTGTGNFTAPYFDVSGGGNGSFYYDTKSIDAANLTVAIIASSVAER
jgi:hypothetical protein